MNEPKIRFNGFEGEWESPSIDDVFYIRNGYTPSKAVKEFWDGGTIPWFRMEDIRENGGILKDAIQHITPLGVKGTGLFEKNSIILATTATIGVHAMLIADSLANQQFTNFSIRKSLSDNYIDGFVYYSFFGIDEWSKKNVNTGGLLSVNMPLLLKQPFLTPEVEEQQKLASYFTHLDTLITSSASRLSSLKQMKAASLQAMFPQEGETVPKIRFKGFEGEWEEKRLGEMCSVNRGVRLTRKDLDRNGTYPVYQNTNYPLGYYNSYNVCKNNPYVIIGGSAGLIGYSCTNFWAADDCAYFGKNDNLNKFFLYNTLVSKSSEIQKNVRGASIPRLDRNVLSDLKIHLPSLPEQQAIASYFTSLDKQITLQSQRLEKLKQIKSACLDKMFA